MKSEALYYAFTSSLFLLAILGFDPLGLEVQVYAIFIAEFASVLIMFGHLFHIRWNENAPSFFKRITNTQTVGLYAFFFVWAGLILVKNNYLFAFINLIVLTSMRGLRIHALHPHSPQVAKTFHLSLVQFFALFMSMVVIIGLSAFSVPVLQSSLLIWGIVYYGINSLLMLLYSRKWAIQGSNL